MCELDTDQTPFEIRWTGPDPWNAEDDDEVVWEVEGDAR